MDEGCEIGHQIQHGVRRRHEQRIARAGAADPVLRMAEFAGLFGGTASLGQQILVDFAHEAKGNREAAPERNKDLDFNATPSRTVRSKALAYNREAFKPCAEVCL